MFCHYCGTNLSDDAVFCKSCGKSLTSAAPSNATSTPAIAVQEQRSVGNRKPKTGLWILLALLLLVVGWALISHSPGAKQFRGEAVQPTPIQPQPQPHNVVLTNPAFTLKAGQGIHYTFKLPPNASSVQVEGTFSASGGGGNDVEVYLMSEDDFVNWHNNHSINPFYNSGRITQSTLNVNLPSGTGTYYLVFTNRFSLLTPKAVQTSIRLHYVTPNAYAQAKEDTEKILKMNDADPGR